MAKNKSPGPDGLPIEFYLKFSFRILPNSKYIAVIYDRVHYSVGGKKVVTHATPRTEGLSVFWIRTTKSLDQEKAFDKVDHKFLFAVQVLESSNMTTRFQINGFLSKQIAVKRRVRQGCPLSPFYILYIYCILEPILRINPGLKSFIIERLRFCGIHLSFGSFKNGNKGKVRLIKPFLENSPSLAK